MDLPAIWTAKRQIEQHRGLAHPPADIEDFLRRRFLNNHPVALRRHAEQLLAEPDRVAELAELGLPVLVVVGVDDDAWPPAVQADMAAHLGAPLAEIADAGHSPAVDQPAATVEALTSFWSRL
jgi:pimeloyl-ACP methyl ester carboxylesterase